MLTLKCISMPYFVSADQQTKLHYHDTGSGKPLVFVAAWAMNLAMWEYQTQFFKEQGFRCISFDRRGHGRSDWSAGDYGYDVLASDLAELLDMLDLRQVCLVGMSMGGGEIIRYLSRYGHDRIDRVVLIAPTAPYLVKSTDNPLGIDGEMFAYTRNQIQEDFPQWLIDNANGFYRPDVFGVSQGIIHWTLNMMLTTSLEAALETSRLNMGADLRVELAALNAPTLIIHGDADESVPVVFGRWAAQLVPNCQYKEYTGAPHGLFYTHRHQLNSDILQFVS
ncbi:alpha/beta hydrolase [Spirosoma knui]